MKAKGIITCIELGPVVRKKIIGTFFLRNCYALQEKKKNRNKAKNIVL